MKPAAVAGILFVGTVAGVAAVAGGRPDQVPFPTGYTEGFLNYSFANRASGKPELAKVFANRIAQEGARAGGTFAPGSVLVMEIHKAELDASGNPVKGSDGTFKSGGIAGIAVMEKRADWPADYPAAERAGDWGFALYDAAGNPKANDLVCASCHQPFAAQDFIVTRAKLDAAVK
jgi:hypothetical protein